jgi:hypothetical protein
MRVWLYKNDEAPVGHKLAPLWDRCYDFLNFFAKKISEKIGIFDWKQS